jgi:hypothetical protein
MADFCNKCAKELGMGKPEIDVYKIFKKLKNNNQSSPYLCEGCGLFTIAKINGKLMVKRRKSTTSKPMTKKEFNSWRRRKYGAKEIPPDILITECVTDDIITIIKFHKSKTRWEEY